MALLLTLATNPYQIRQLPLFFKSRQCFKEMQLELPFDFKSIMDDTENKDLIHYFLSIATKKESV
jgi:hypothetical protein